MNLKRGDKGQNVKVVQLALQTLGYYRGTPDGDFGPATEAALVKWEQERYADAEVGDDELAYFQTVVAVPSLPKVPNGYDELTRLFGKPWEDGTRDGSVWWTKWQEPVHVPASFAFNRSDTLYVNRYVVPVVEATFNDIDRRGLASQVKTFDGCFNVRPIRGYEAANPPRYSIHTWGLAIDLNAATNGLGIVGDMHPGIVAAFKSFGWVWGGDFKRLDPMHFQYCVAC